MRYISALAAFAFATQAHAGCVKDGQSLETAANFAAVTRLCPQFRSMSDKVALEMLITMGSVDPVEAASATCLTEVGIEIAQKTADFSRIPKGERACESNLSDVRSQAAFYGWLKEKGVVRSQTEPPRP